MRFPLSARELLPLLVCGALASCGGTHSSSSPFGGAPAAFGDTPSPEVAPVFERPDHHTLGKWDTYEDDFFGYRIDPVGYVVEDAPGDHQPWIVVLQAWHPKGNGDLTVRVHPGARSLDQVRAEMKQALKSEQHDGIRTVSMGFHQALICEWHEDWTGENRLHTELRIPAGHRTFRINTATDYKRRIQARHVRRLLESFEVRDPSSAQVGGALEEHYADPTWGFRTAALDDWMQLSGGDELDRMGLFFYLGAEDPRIKVQVFLDPRACSSFRPWVREQAMSQGLRSLEFEFVTHRGFPAATLKAVSSRDGKQVRTLAVQAPGRVIWVRADHEAARSAEDIARIDAVLQSLRIDADLDPVWSLR